MNRRLTTIMGIAATGAAFYSATPLHADLLTNTRATLLSTDRFDSPDPIFPSLSINRAIRTMTASRVNERGDVIISGTLQRPEGGGDQNRPDIIWYSPAGTEASSVPFVQTTQQGDRFGTFVLLDDGRIVSSFGVGSTSNSRTRLDVYDGSAWSTLLTVSSPLPNSPNSDGNSPQYFPLEGPKVNAQGKINLVAEHVFDVSYNWAYQASLNGDPVQLLAESGTALPGDELVPGRQSTSQLNDRGDSLFAFIEATHLPSGAGSTSRGLYVLRDDGTGGVVYGARSIDPYTNEVFTTNHLQSLLPSNLSAGSGKGTVLRNVTNNHAIYSYDRDTPSDLTIIAQQGSAINGMAGYTINQMVNNKLPVTDNAGTVTFHARITDGTSQIYGLFQVDADGGAINPILYNGMSGIDGYETKVVSDFTNTAMWATNSLGQSIARLTLTDVGGANLVTGLFGINTDGSIFEVLMIGDTLDIRGETATLVSITPSSWNSQNPDSGLGTAFNDAGYLVYNAMVNINGTNVDSILVTHIEFAPVPEPATLGLLAAGLLSIARRRR